MLTLLLLTLLACDKTETPTAEKAAADKTATGTTTAEKTTSAPSEKAASPDAIPAPADVAAPPADAQTTPTGLASKVLQAGTGTTHPAPEDTVEVHYTGWSKDGVMFDSSVTRNKPASFPLTRVIAGWTEGLQLMVEGEKRRFWIPADLAYGEVAKRPGAPSGQLTFDVELIKITAAPKPVPAPDDVAAAPKSAKTTKTGLKYQVLQKGTGAVHPTSADKVQVHYTGWTTDGKMFDSSVTRGEPASFPVNRVIPGWTEGLQLMVVGEKTRFWIPADLAYGVTPKRPGAPAGPLTFDVELLGIQ